MKGEKCVHVYRRATFHFDSAPLFLSFFLWFLTWSLRRKKTAKGAKIISVLLVWNIDGGLKCRRSSWVSSEGGWGWEMIPSLPRHYTMAAKASSERVLSIFPISSFLSFHIRVIPQKKRRTWKSVDTILYAFLDVPSSSPSTTLRP